MVFLQNTKPIRFADVWDFERSWLSEIINSTGQTCFAGGVVISLSHSDDGVWRSWLARAVWDREVEGSSPFTPTKKKE